MVRMQTVGSSLFLLGYWYAFPLAQLSRWDFVPQCKVMLPLYSVLDLFCLNLLSYYSVPVSSSFSLSFSSLYYITYYICLLSVGVLPLYLFLLECFYPSFLSRFQLTIALLSFLLLIYIATISQGSNVFSLKTKAFPPSKMASFPFCGTPVFILASPFFSSFFLFCI